MGTLLLRVAGRRAIDAKFGGGNCHPALPRGRRPYSVRCAERCIRTAPVSPYDDVLPPEEFERRLAAALESFRGPEGAQIEELIEWFLRRYPEPLDRLRYARRKYEEVKRMRNAVKGSGATHDSMRGLRPAMKP